MCEIKIECFKGYIEGCGESTVRFDGLIITNGSEVTRVRAPYKFEIVNNQVTITSVFQPDQYAPVTTLTMGIPEQYTTTELITILNNCKCC